MSEDSDSCDDTACTNQRQVAHQNNRIIFSAAIKCADVLAEALVISRQQQQSMKHLTEAWANILKQLEPSVSLDDQ